MKKVLRGFNLLAGTLSLAAFAQQSGPQTGGPNNGAQGQQQGGPMGGSPGAPQVSQKECDAAGKKARRYALGCLNQKDWNKRSQCFAGFEKKTGIPSHVFEGCRQVFEPLKNEIKQKEMAKYPNQKSAVDENGEPNGGQQGQGPNSPGSPQHGGPQAGGPNNGSPNALKASQKECDDAEKKVRNHALSCLNQKDWNKRSQCFEGIGTKMGIPDYVFEGCTQVLKPLKNEIKQKELSMYPNQQSAVDGNGGPGDGQHPQGPNSPGSPQQGGPNNGQQGQQQAQWPQDKCQKEAPKLKKLGENCLNIKKADLRMNCFDKVGNSFPKGFFEGCRGVVEPIKAEIEAKEKQKYPNDAHGVSHNNQGPNSPGNSQQGGPQTAGPNNGQQGTQQQAWNSEKCTKLMPELHKGAEGCLKNKDPNQRGACFEQLGTKFPPGFFEGCSSQTEALKAKMKAKEKQMYPDQESKI